MSHSAIAAGGRDTLALAHRLDCTVFFGRMARRTDPQQIFSLFESAGITPLQVIPSK